MSEPVGVVQHRMYSKAKQFVNQSFPKIFSSLSQIIFNKREYFMHDARTTQILNSSQRDLAFQPHDYTFTINRRQDVNHCGIYRSWVGRSGKKTQGHIIIYVNHPYIIEHGLSKLYEVFAHEIAHAIHENIYRVEKQGRIVTRYSCVSMWEQHNKTFHRFYTIVAEIINNITPDEHNIYIGDYVDTLQWMSQRY